MYKQSTKKKNPPKLPQGCFWTKRDKIHVSPGIFPCNQMDIFSFFLHCSKQTKWLLLLFVFSSLFKVVFKTKISWSGHCDLFSRVLTSRRRSGRDPVDPLGGDGVLHQTLHRSGHQHDTADPGVPGGEGLLHTGLQPHRLRHQVEFYVS